MHGFCKPENSVRFWDRAQIKKEKIKLKKMKMKFKYKRKKL